MPNPIVAETLCVWVCDSSITLLTSKETGLWLPRTAITIRWWWLFDPIPLLASLEILHAAITKGALNEWPPCGLLSSNNGTRKIPCRRHQDEAWQAEGAFHVFTVEQNQLCFQALI